VTLPVGQWYVIGASPDQTTGRIESGRPGKICKVNFDPVWAISVGGGPGARVICIPLIPAPPALPTDRKPVPTLHLRQWVAIIYDAAMRRPKFASLLPNADQTLIDNVWKQYASLARRIKRPSGGAVDELRFAPLLDDSQRRRLMGGFSPSNRRVGA
jgi:hypothetical protein